jgi:hypothetical protein
LERIAATSARRKIGKGSRGRQREVKKKKKLGDEDIKTELEQA